MTNDETVVKLGPGSPAKHSRPEPALRQAGFNWRRIMRLLRKKYSQYRRMAIDQRPIILITPSHITGWGAL